MLSLGIKFSQKQKQTQKFSISVQLYVSMSMSQLILLDILKYGEQYSQPYISTLSSLGI